MCHIDVVNTFRGQDVDVLSGVGKWVFLYVRASSHKVQQLPVPNARLVELQNVVSLEPFLLLIFDDVDHLVQVNPPNAVLLLVKLVGQNVHIACFSDEDLLNNLFFGVQT